MSRLDTELQVLKVARRLGLNGWQAPAKEIINFCQAKIDRWVQESGQVRTILDLEALVCEKLQLVIEEVWSNEDLDALISKYVALGEWVFASLHMQLDASTFGTTMMRNNAAPDAHDRYVAVIDCRGAKAA